MIALGLDLSLTGSGWAIVDTDRGTLDVDTIVTKPGVPMESRLEYIAQEIPARAHLACIETLAHGAKGDAKDVLAAVSWMVRVKLWKLGIPYAMVSTSQVKLYGAGRGLKVEKAEMIDALIRRLGVDRCPRIADDNQADAAWLALLAAERLGSPLVDLPQANRAVLGRVDWPDLLSDDVLAAS